MPLLVILSASFLDTSSYFSPPESLPSSRKEEDCSLGAVHITDEQTDIKEAV